MTVLKIVYHIREDQQLTLTVFPPTAFKYLSLEKPKEIEMALLDLVGVDITYDKRRKIVTKIEDHKDELI